MENEERKDEGLTRLEERTSALERCDRRHYVIEVVLFIAFILLTLVVVASCDIKTPNKVVESKEWVYTENVKHEDLSFTVNEDGESITAVYCNRSFAVEKNDTTDIVFIGLSLSILVEDEKITIYDGDKSVIGFFEYR